MIQSRNIINRIRLYLLKQKGVQLHSTVLLDKYVSMNLSSPFFEFSGGVIKIDEESKIGQGVVIDAYGGMVSIGKRVYIGPYTVLYGHGNIDIGDDTLIAMGCSIVSANHDVPAADQLIRLQPDVAKSIIIGKDVWLGAGVKIMAGVTIGDGCVVGAGSVVTKSLPPYSIAIGVPAQIKGSRS